MVIGDPKRLRTLKKDNIGRALLFVYLSFEQLFYSKYETIFNKEY